MFQLLDIESKWPWNALILLLSVLDGNSWREDIYMNKKAFELSSSLGECCLPPTGQLLCAMPSKMALKHQPWAPSQTFYSTEVLLGHACSGLAATHFRFPRFMKMAASPAWLAALCSGAQPAVCLADAVLLYTTASGQRINLLITMRQR